MDSMVMPGPLYAGRAQIRVTLAAILASCPKEVNEIRRTFGNKTVTTGFIRKANTKNGS